MTITTATTVKAIMITRTRKSSVVLAAELSGTWSSERGNILELDFDNETYYETFYGRGGAQSVGTVGNDHNGKGIYLYLNGKAYLGDNYTIGEDSSELYDEYGNYIRGLW